MGDVDAAAALNADKKTEDAEKAKKVGVVSPGVIKAGLGVTAAGFFGIGVRSAWRYTRTPEAADLTRPQVFSGVTFAARSLGVATLISCSGFALLLIGVSAVLNVNTPREFGRAMRSAFGDRFRLPQSRTQLSAASFEELITVVKQKQEPATESISSSLTTSTSSSDRQ